jgi:hypothetical protein
MELVQVGQIRELVSQAEPITAVVVVVVLDQKA